MNWFLYTLIAILFSGISPVLAKNGMRKSNGFLAAAIGGTAFVCSSFFMNLATGSLDGLWKMGWKTFLFFTLSGIFIAVIGFSFLNALKTGEIIRVVPIIEASIVIHMLLDILVFHHRFTVPKLLFMVLLGSGIVLMEMRSSKGRGSRKNYLGYAFTTMILVSLVTFLEDNGVNGFHGNRFWAVVIAVLVAWIVTFISGGYKGLFQISFMEGIYLCLSGITIALARYFLFKGYQYGEDALVNVVMMFDFVTAVIFGCVLKQERLSTKAIVGLFLIVAAFLLLL